MTGPFLDLVNSCRDELNSVPCPAACQSHRKVVGSAETSFGKEFDNKARFESLCSIKGIGEAPIENSTTASKIAIQASAKKQKKGSTSKHKNQSRQGRVKVEKRS